MSLVRKQEGERDHSNYTQQLIDLHDQFIPLGKVMSAAAYNCSANGAHGGGIILPVEIAAYGNTKIWDDQGLKSNGPPLPCFLPLTNSCFPLSGRLTGKVDGQIYRYIREIALFWQCYLVKTTRPDGSYVYNDLYDCCYEICRCVPIVVFVFNAPSLMLFGHV